MLSALIALAARAAASPIEEDDPAAIPVDDAPVDELPGDEDAFAPRTDLAELGRVHDAPLRRRVPTAWGRIDLALAWRSTERDLRRSDEVWLVATWRR